MELDWSMCDRRIDTNTLTHSHTHTLTHLRGHGGGGEEEGEKEEAVDIHAAIVHTEPNNFLMSIFWCFDWIPADWLWFVG